MKKNKQLGFPVGKKINPGINIQVQEVSISHKRQTLNHLSIASNNTSTIFDLIFKKTSTAEFKSECKELAKLVQ